MIDKWTILDKYNWELYKDKWSYYLKSYLHMKNMIKNVVCLTKTSWNSNEWCIKEFVNELICFCHRVLSIRIFKELFETFMVNFDYFIEVY